VVGLIVAAAIAAVAIGTAAYARRAYVASDPDQARRKDLPIPVRTTLVKQTDVKRMIGGTAITVASNMAIIRSEASRSAGMLPNGISSSPRGLAVTKVHVQYGDRVRAGQLLIDLDDNDYVASIKTWHSLYSAGDSEVKYRRQVLETNKRVRELAVQRAGADVKYRTTDLVTRAKLSESFERLSKTGAVSVATYLESRTQETAAEYEKAIAGISEVQAKIDLTLGTLKDQYDLEQAISRREQASTAIDLARRSAEACHLHSPLDGYVGKVDVVPGQIVDGSNSLMEVYRINPLWVNMDFPQERIGELSLGLPAEVVVDSYPNETFRGRIVAILPQARPALRILPVYIQIDNPDGRIKSSVTGFARVIVSGKVTTVPQTAVIQDIHRATVFVIENGRAKLRQIKTGYPVENGEVEVLSGLSTGAEVAVYGNVGLQDNDLVNTDWRKWARRQ
jgi:multidrug resistance efflux pump